MEISYNFRFADYEALTIAMRSAGQRKLALAVFCLALFANAAAALLIARMGSLYVAAINASMALFLLLAFFVLIPALRRWNYRRLNLEGKKIHISIGSDGVRSAQQGIEGTFQWSAFTRFSKTRQHAFLWINRLQALVLPFDAFASSAERDQCLALIASKIPLEQ